MTLSVVIATKDRPQELEATVVSLLEQIPTADELIIIDQSANSASREAVERVVSNRRTGSGKAPLLRYVHDISIQGAAPARNVGVDLAGGDILVFFDDDITLEPDFFREILAVYEQDPMVAGVSGIITNYERPPAWQRVFLRLFWRGPFHDERQPLYWNAAVIRNCPPIRVKKFGTTGMSLRRAALGSLRFDHRLRNAWPGEDVDLCYRLGANCKLVIAPKARFIHKRTPTNRPTDHWIKRDVQATHYLYWRNWNRELTNRLCFAWLNLGYAVLATLGSLRRCTLEPWRVFLEARQQASAYREPSALSPARPNQSKPLNP